ncbi:hypothetical protein [Streptomyces sp. NPDC057413]|uniref:hypothetical protein n=1 Tax=Streptomyces sp. NPDC057413 TaxID=3346124 RepID=UPI003692777A
MTFKGQVWHLRGEAGALGQIAVDDSDFPWLHGRFTAGPAFDSVRALFERELELADAEDWAGWERVLDDIDRAVTLHAPHGPVAAFLLHIEGDRAWFRWSDEPVSEGPSGGDASPADPLSGAARP